MTRQNGAGIVPGGGPGNRWCRFRFSVIFPVLVFTVIESGTAATAESAAVRREAPEIRLTAPGNHHRLRAEAVTFEWVMEQADSGEFAPEYYEVMFWSKHRNFSFIRTVYPEEVSGGSLRMPDASIRFKRHGRYYWQVQAVSRDGRRLESDVHEFRVPIPEKMQSASTALFPYAVKWEKTQRLSHDTFNQLMQNVYPQDHLQGHSDLCLIFRQPMIYRLRIDLQEQVYFNSNIGLGGELSMRLRLYDNLYFALQPTATTSLCWFGTGLERYSSRRFQAYTGIDFIINPKGYVSSNLKWIPAYRFHYADKENGLRIFDGNGWEWGMRVVIPRTILNPFRLAGIEVDMERMPIEYTYSRIKDSYTQVVMPSQKIGISILFQ